MRRNIHDGSDGCLLYCLLPSEQQTSPVSTNQNGDERRLLDLCVYVCSLRKLIFKI